LASNPVPPDRIAYLIQISELIRNYGLVLAAALGLVLAWWRSRASNRQAIAALQHVVEMFNRAVDQLGSERLEVRLGAIYTLKRISRDPQYVDYRIPILETLTAYVRERTREDTSAEPPVDVREIMSLLNESLSEPNKS
jgi:hypothetical protein